MLPPPTDSAGARILKKMGWRLGQGIGPRVSLRQRKLQDAQALRGTEDIITIPEDDEEASKHTYAPRDTRILLVDRKDNSHGLGYQPGMGLNESLGVKGSKGKVGPNLAGVPSRQCDLKGGSLLLDSWIWARRSQRRRRRRFRCLRRWHQP